MKLPSRTHLLIGTLSLSLIASAGLNVVLFERGKEYYLTLQQTRLDPLSIRSYPSERDLLPVLQEHQHTVVFFGDSRAAQWPAPTDLSDIVFVNRGIGGQTSAQVLQRFEVHVKSLQPEVVLIQVGINDLRTIPLFPDQKTAIIANYKEHLRDLIAKAVNSGATVILTTIFPVGDISLQQSLIWSPDVEAAVEEANQYIRSLQSRDVIIFDTYTLLARDGKVRPEYAQDSLHLNALAYEALNKELIQVLKHEL